MSEDIEVRTVAVGEGRRVVLVNGSRVGYLQRHASPARWCFEPDVRVTEGPLPRAGSRPTKALALAALVAAVGDAVA